MKTLFALALVSLFAPSAFAQVAEEEPQFCSYSIIHMDGSFDEVVRADCETYIEGSSCRKEVTVDGKPQLISVDELECAAKKME